MSRWMDSKGHGKVVPLHDGVGHDPRLSPLRQIEAYWSALCPVGDVPERSAIDPRGIENVLQYAFVLERVAPGVARFRIAGQHLTTLAGVEVRGMPVTVLMNPAARSRMGAVLEHLFDTPAVADLTLSGKRGMGAPRQQARMLLLPLKSDSGQINRALGALICEGGSDATAGRFDLDDISFRPISGRAIVSPETRPETLPQRSPEPARQFAEAQRPFDGPVPHLRVVVSND